MAKIVTVKQDPAKEVPTEVLADAIVTMAEGVRRLRAGRLNDKALCMLIAHAAPSLPGRPPKPVSMREVRSVLDGINALEATYLKPKRA